MDPDDNVHKWTNFLKSYELPTVAGISVDKNVTSIQVPLLTAGCLLLALLVIINPAGLLSGRKALTGFFGLLIAGAAAYPVARVEVGKPAMLAPELAEAEISGVMQQILDNVYRAFDFREEEDVYDKLALSVDGELLVDVYLQNRKSMQVQRAGGAQARVREVELLETESNPNPDQQLSYDVRATWSALGTVGHWGHVHTRKNRYQAVVTLSVVDNVWKITGLNLLDEARIDPYSNEVLDGRG